MKKLFLTFIVLLACMYIHAQQPINLSGSSFDHSSTGHTPPKNPVTLPVVYLDDYTLTFETNHPEILLAGNPVSIL